MTKMIERMARAIHHEEAEPHKAKTGYGDVWGWEDVMPAVRERHMRFARAALDAMKEPTPAMIAAMDEHAGTIAPEYAYQSAITVALEEGE